MEDSKLRKIWKKTQGHCHFCGDSIEFKKRGWHNGDLTGYWEVDHVIQRDKGGNDSTENYLPTCTECNRLRWHHTGKKIREILLLGLVAKKEVKDNTKIGKAIIELKKKRLLKNIKRRVSK